MLWDELKRNYYKLKLIAFSRIGLIFLSFRLFNLSCFIFREIYIDKSTTVEEIVFIKDVIA